MKRKGFSNKKGSLADIFIFMIVAFILVMGCVVMFYIGNTAKEQILLKAPVLQEVLSPEDNATTIINNTFGNVTNSYQALKWITAVLIVGYIISMLIMSFLITSHPVFFIPYLILNIIAIVCSVPMSNAYEVVYATPSLASSFSGFFGANFIFLHLPIWITIISFITTALLVINIKRQQGLVA